MFPTRDWQLKLVSNLVCYVEGSGPSVQLSYQVRFYQARVRVDGMVCIDMSECFKHAFLLFHFVESERSCPY